MNSFMSIGASKSASLDVVAPGIAEALIAPRSASSCRHPGRHGSTTTSSAAFVCSRASLETFSKDYLNIVRRHFLG
ncbi:MAG: hypothetical protein R3B99_11045 [Polyangiales bacterium]